jgi:hypothetical protein
LTWLTSVLSTKLAPGAAKLFNLSQGAFYPASNPRGRCTWGIILKLHLDILVKNGKKQFAVLPYEKFVALQERLADAEDLLELRKAKRAEGKKTLAFPGGCEATIKRGLEFPTNKK